MILDSPRIQVTVIAISRYFWYSLCGPEYWENINSDPNPLMINISPIDTKTIG